MKNTILAVLMFVMLPIIGKAEVRNSLSVKNNTDETVKIAYVWYNKVEHCWKSRGWYKIKPYGEFVIDLNWKGTNLGSNTMYVSAKMDSKKWSGNAEFRVDHSQGFEISFADKFSSKMETGKFTTVEVGEGNTIFTINP